MISRLSKIQQTLKAPKNQFNEFGKYKYRSCEDILEAVKSLLGDDIVLTLSDEIVEIGGRVYVKATASIKNFFDDERFREIRTTAYAREAETKKGMDDAQITGSASSYARKYALNGLFLIDDTKDADTMDNGNHKTKEIDVPEPNEKAIITDLKKRLSDMLGNMSKEDKKRFFVYALDGAEESVDSIQHIIDKLDDYMEGWAR